MTVRPSVILTAHVDSRLDPESDLTQALKRSYLYIAPVRANFHEEPIDEQTQAAILSAATDGEGNVDEGRVLAASLEAVPPHCAMRVAVRLHKPYWETDDPAAVELWDTMMDRWLRNIIAKISNTMVAFNIMRRRNGGLEVPFESMLFEFEGKALIEVALGPDCAAAKDTAAMLKRARAWFNSGIAAQSVALLRIPLRAEVGAEAAPEDGAVAKDGAAAAALDPSAAEALFRDGTSRTVAL